MTARTPPIRMFTDPGSGLARVPLGTFPTPLQELANLSEYVDRQILVKRDDLSGLAFGGNKVRKLEYLMADAVGKQYDTVVSNGFLQSNNVVQTAAAAARVGLRAVSVLEANKPQEELGNLILSRYLGAEMVYTDGQPIGDVIASTRRRIEVAGHRPYMLPPGGSTPVGIAGFVSAAAEVRDQLVRTEREVDAIILATGTGGTQAGLVLGNQIIDSDTLVYGLSVGKTREELTETIPRFARETGNRIGWDWHDVGRWEVTDEFVGDGYAQPDRRDFDTIQLVARLEGLFLDPVYTGRAMRGLIELLKMGAVPGKGAVLFWHTGGLPALFAISHDE